jgi:hypothetical protein
LDYQFGYNRCIRLSKTWTKKEIVTRACPPFRITQILNGPYLRTDESFSYIHIDNVLDETQQMTIIIGETLGSVRK